MDYVIVLHSRRLGNKVAYFLANQGYRSRDLELDMSWPLTSLEEGLEPLQYLLEKDRSNPDVGVISVVRVSLEGVSSS